MIASAKVHELARRSDRLWRAMLVSAAIHAGLFAVGLAWPRPPAYGRKFLPVTLVMLGDEPSRAAARHMAAPASRPAADVPVLDVAAEQAIPPRDPDAPAVRSGRAVTPGHPLGNTLGPIVGSPGEGIREGWVRIPGGMMYADPDGASARDYVAAATAALQSASETQGGASDRTPLSAVIVIRVEPGGSIVGWSFDVRSGSADFDDAIERAIRTSRLPPPPPELCERYRTDGLRLTLRM